MAASLVIGNLLLLFYAVFWYHGIALYGGIDNIGKRDLSNIAFALLTEGLLLYYVFVDFDTCKRVIAFSGYFFILYTRIALEPYCLRRWKTYSMYSP